MRYLYYRLWRLITKIRTNDMPAFNAMILIGLCQLLNMFLVYIFLQRYSIIDIHFTNKSEIMSYTIPIGVMVYSFDYFYLYKYRHKLHEKYKNESRNKRVLGNVLLYAYVVLSIGLVFYFGPKYTMK